MLHMEPNAGMNKMLWNKQNGNGITKEKETAPAWRRGMFRNGSHCKQGQFGNLQMSAHKGKHGFNAQMGKNQLDARKDTKKRIKVAVWQSQTSTMVHVPRYRMRLVRV